MVCHTLKSEQKQQRFCSDVVLVFAFCPSPGALLQFSFFSDVWCIRRMFGGRAGTYQKEGGWGGGYVSDLLVSFYVWDFNYLYPVGFPCC